MKQLIKYFEDLHTLDQTLSPREVAALKYLRALEMSEQDLKVTGLITLLKSISSLRQLAHVQLSEVVRAHAPQTSGSGLQRREEPIQPSEHLIRDVPEIPTSEPLRSVEYQGEDAETAYMDQPEVETRVERLPKTPSPLELFEPITEPPLAIERSSAHSETPVDMSASETLAGAPESPREPSSRSEDLKSVDQHQDQHELIEDDELDLEALQREVESLTQPVFDQEIKDDALQSTPVNSLLPGSVNLDDEAIPDFMSDVNESLGDLDVTPAFEVNEGEAQDEPSQEAASAEFSASEDDFEAFPFSAGEAGTAIFDADALDHAQMFQRPGSVPPQVQQAAIATDLPPMYARVVTPDVSFKGRIDTFTERGLVVFSDEKLHRGEQVELSFTLPSSQESVTCLALVRSITSANEPPFGRSTLSLHLYFLNLRPQQESLISAEMKLRS